MLISENKIEVYNFKLEKILTHGRAIQNNDERREYYEKVLDKHINNVLILDESKYNPEYDLDSELRKEISSLGVDKKKKESSSKRYNLEESAYRFVNAYVKFYSIGDNRKKRITYRILEKYSNNYLSYSSWTSRFRDPVFWVQVEAQRIKKIDSKNVQVEITSTILSEKLRDYIVKEEKKVKLAKHRIATKNEKKAKNNSKFKEKKISDINTEDEDFFDSYANIDTNPFSQDSEDVYEQLEKDID